MIDAKELRIGNYIQSGKGIYEVQVLCPDGVLGMCGLKDRSLISCGGTTIIKPIEITKEWLLKFGFELMHKNDSGIRYDSPDTKIDYVWNLRDKSKGLRWYGQLIKCEYVHELQNLYFALTGEELRIVE